MSLYYFSRLMSRMSVQEACIYAPKEMWYMYTMEYHSHQKKKNNAICHNMDGPRDWQPEWSISEKERQYHMISLTHRNKQTDKKDTNELIFKTETDS